MRQRLQWENHCEDKAFSSAVRIIVFDDDKRAWIGDDAGRVKVRGLMQKRHNRCCAVLAWCFLKRVPLVIRVHWKLIDVAFKLYSLV
jgi:hypothetical protein